MAVNHGARELKGEHQNKKTDANYRKTVKNEENTALDKWNTLSGSHTGTVSYLQFTLPNKIEYQTNDMLQMDKKMKVTYKHHRRSR